MTPVLSGLFYWEHVASLFTNTYNNQALISYIVEARLYQVA